MNNQQLAKEFWENGYLVIDNFFDMNLMDNYQEQIIQHFNDQPDYLHNEEFLQQSSTDVIPWFPQREGVKDFDIIAQDEKLTALTTAIIGAGWSELYSMVMFSNKNSKGQAWHQDCPPEDKRQFNLNRLVYTMNIDTSIGGQTLVLPKSHKMGAITNGDINEDFNEQIILSPEKGTLVLLHGHTWHRVLPVTGKYRVSTNYRCSPKNTPSDITDTCVYRNMRYHFPTNTLVKTE